MRIRSSSGCQGLQDQLAGRVPLTRAPADGRWRGSSRVPDTAFPYSCHSHPHKDKPGQGLPGEPAVALRAVLSSGACCQVCPRWAPGGPQDSHVPPCHGNPRVISCSNILISFPILPRSQAEQAQSLHTHISLSLQPQTPLSISSLQTALLLLFFFF